ncbi:MAG: sugar phosphate nucleotidyltransferase, partial [Bdellovibrionota bacterium]
MNFLPRKAVIPAAGLGTRLLPATFAVPKELLPIVEGRGGRAVLRPVLHLVVEEASRAGVTEVILVTSPGKEGIAGYFRRPSRLARRLDGTKQADLL